MKLTATISDAKSTVGCLLEKGDVRKSYTISLESFIASLSDSVSHRAYTLGELPQGYVNGQLFSLSNDAFSGIVILKVPAAQRLITYCDEPFVIPMPELLFKLTFRDGKLVKDCVVSLNRAGTPCYYPFTNVYNDGHICWGTFKLPKICSFKDTEQIPELFLRFPGNSDLGYSGTKEKAKAMSMGEVYKKLERKNKFPEKWLVPIGVSYEEFCMF